MGKLFEKQGLIDKALTEQRAALVLAEAVYGKVHTACADIHNDIGILLRKKGEHHEAMTELEIALALRETLLGGNHHEIAGTNVNIGTILCDLGLLEFAMIRLQSALAMYQSEFGPEHYKTSIVIKSIALIKLEEGDTAGALEDFKHVVAIRKKTLGVNEVEVAEAYRCTGRALQYQESWQEASVEYRKALAILLERLGPAHPLAAGVMIDYNRSIREIIKEKRNKKPMGADTEDEPGDSMTANITGLVLMLGIACAIYFRGRRS